MLKYSSSRFSALPDDILQEYLSQLTINDKDGNPYLADVYQIEIFCKKIFFDVPFYKKDQLWEFLYKRDFDSRGKTPETIKYYKTKTGKKNPFYKELYVFTFYELIYYSIIHIIPAITMKFHVDELDPYLLNLFMKNPEIKFLLISENLNLDFPGQIYITILKLAPNIIKNAILYGAIEEKMFDSILEQIFFDNFDFFSFFLLHEKNNSILALFLIKHDFYLEKDLYYRPMLGYYTDGYYTDGYYIDEYLPFSLFLLDYMLKNYYDSKEKEKILKNIAMQMGNIISLMSINNDMFRAEQTAKEYLLSKFLTASKEKEIFLKRVTIFGSDEITKFVLENLLSQIEDLFIVSLIKISIEKGKKETLKFYRFHFPSIYEKIKNEYIENMRLENDEMRNFTIDRNLSSFSYNAIIFYIEEGFLDIFDRIFIRQILSYIEVFKYVFTVKLGEMLKFDDFILFTIILTEIHRYYSKKMEDEKIIQILYDVGFKYNLASGYFSGNREKEHIFGILIEKNSELINLWPELPEIRRNFVLENRTDPLVLEKLHLFLFSDYENIEETTRVNSHYRHVVNTTLDNQLVLMSLLPDEIIPLEIHDDLTQFIRIEQGEGILVIKSSLEPDSVILSEKVLRNGISIQISRGVAHEIRAIGSGLKLYTVYSKPHHRHGLIQKRMKDALK